MNIQLIDSHCHIHFSEYSYTDIDADIVEAHAVGVAGFLGVSVDLATSKESVQFAKNRKNVWPVAGIHPHEASKTLKYGLTNDFVEFVRANKQDIVGIGECGLDYFYNHSPREQQLKILEMQLQLAIDHDLPVSFHVREAFDDFWPVVDNFSRLRGVLHSFTDSPANIEKAINYGLYIGVNGIITFSKDEVWREAIRRLALEKILLETDAPYLTPKPYRGKINKLAYVRLTAEYLAKIKDCDLLQVASVTSLNTQELFRIKLYD